MIVWYDKDGKPIEGTEDEASSPRWKKAMNKVEKLLKDKDYKIIKQELTPDKKYWISTVWLGLDHSFSWVDLEKPNPYPIIFETMVFAGRKNSWYLYKGKRRYVRKTYEQVRYGTQSQAIAGHNAMLKEYTDKERKR